MYQSSYLIRIHDIAGIQHDVLKTVDLTVLYRGLQIALNEKQREAHFSFSDAKRVVQ